MYCRLEAGTSDDLHLNTIGEKIRGCEAFKLFIASITDSFYLVSEGGILKRVITDYGL